LKAEVELFFFPRSRGIAHGSDTGGRDENPLVIEPSALPNDRPASGGAYDEDANGFCVAAE
jgi:hypothetical protein